MTKKKVTTKNKTKETTATKGKRGKTGCTPGFKGTPNLEGVQKKEIDFDYLIKLCEIQCTGQECAAALNIDYATLNARIKENFGYGFLEYFEKHRQLGLKSLRRRQYDVAMSGDVQMLKHLGKHWLHQIDKTIVDNTSSDGSMTPKKIVRVIHDVSDELREDILAADD